MMHQKLIVPIDHGNCNLKTENHVFTSGIIESDCRPVLGEYMYYNGRYYALSEQRIPYMRDKSKDERFFILTLFGIAREAEKQMLNQKGISLQVALPVGLPPKHYGALHKKFQEYFMGRGMQEFTYNGRKYEVEIEDAAVFPQDYAAAMTIYPQIQGYNKVVTVDIGGFTLDYLLLRNGRPDLSVCDSLEKGVITLYNKVISRVNSEYDILLEEVDIDSIIKGERTDYDASVICMDENVIIIFVSSYDKYMMELFRLDVFAFVKKPINPESFSETFLEANQKICSKNFFFPFKYRNQEYKIPCKDILYYESRGRQITIYEKGGTTYVFNGKLSNVEENLEEGKIPFLRIHQSYLVNYFLIRSRTKSEVILTDGTKLPISEDRQKKFSRDYGKLLRGEING